MKFFLGVHEPAWLARTSVPLFVSHRRLARRVVMPVAVGPWALDSGGFSELSMFGGWRTELTEYIDATARYAAEVGHLAWASPMDWMCEPFITAKTRLAVDTHQALTVENVALLRQIAPELPWVPVLQGWTIDDYLRCIERYVDAGIDPAIEPVVGVGSVCRRQATAEIAEIFTELAGTGIACHGFGVKVLGVERYGHLLTSADSMAWSFDARHSAPMAGCAHPHCNNCLRYALAWRARLLARIGPREVTTP